MGVTGLWQIIDSVGHPVKIDGLEGKRLGVDANVWLYKFVRGFREKETSVSIEGHKLGLFNRISKLLFYKIKPVFVFDGPAPALKRKTLERRQNVRSKHLIKVQEAAMKLLAGQLKESYPGANLDYLRINLPELKSNNLVAAEKFTDEDRELFYLPPETHEIEDDDKKCEIERDLSVDIESKDFANLPPEVRYELLVDIRESRRKIRRLNNLPEDSSSFSNFQMSRLRSRRYIQEKIEQCEKEICSLFTGSCDGTNVESYRVQSDSSATMMYLKKNSATSSGVNESKPKDEEPTNEPPQITRSIDVQPIDIQPIDVQPKTVRSNPSLSLPRRKEIVPVIFNTQSSSSIKESPQELKSWVDLSDDSSSSSSVELVRSNSESIMLNEKEQSEEEFISSSSSSCDETILESYSATEESIDATQPSVVEEVETTPEIVEIVFEKSNAISDPDDESETSLVTESKNLSCPQSDQVHHQDQPQHNSQPSPKSCASQNRSNIDEETPTMKFTGEDKEISCLPPETHEIEDDDKRCEIDSSVDIGSKDFAKLPPEDGVYKVPSSLDESSRDSLEKSKMPSDQLKDSTQKQKDKSPAPTCLSREEIRQVVSQQQSHERASLRVTTKIVEEAKELLRLFGIPYIDASGEAEAQCAQLEELKLTEGTITDDSDVWLFGARNVYRHFFNDDKYVMHYKMTDIEYHVRMTRENLICLAMLVGSDYTEGIMNVGPVTALEILSEFPGPDLEPLVKFRKWKRKYEASKDKIPGSKKRESFLKFRLPEEFPSRAVFEGYMRPAADTSTTEFVWGTPELDELREYARRNFGWEIKKIDEKLLPVMKRLSERKTQPTIDSFFFKTAANQNPELFRSKRVNQALTKIAKKTSDLVKEEEDEEKNVVCLSDESDCDTKVENVTTEKSSKKYSRQSTKSQKNGGATSKKSATTSRAKTSRKK